MKPKLPHLPWPLLVVSAQRRYSLIGYRLEEKPLFFAVKKNAAKKSGLGRLSSPASTWQRRTGTRFFPLSATVSAPYDTPSTSVSAARTSTPREIGERFQADGLFPRVWCASSLFNLSNSSRERERQRKATSNQRQRAAPPENGRTRRHAANEEGRRSARPRTFKEGPQRKWGALAFCSTTVARCGKAVSPSALLWGGVLSSRSFSWHGGLRVMTAVWRLK